MNLFKICGEKIENVKRSLVVAILFQIYSFLPYELQSESSSKQVRREQFKKRQKSAQTERRKERNRALNVNNKAQRDDKRQNNKYVQQGLFTCDEENKTRIKYSIASLFNDVERNMHKAFTDPDTIALMSNKLASVVSVAHLLHKEKRPSKIIATLTLAITSIIPELSQKSIKNTLNFSSAQIAYFKERFGFNPFEQQAVFDDDNKDTKWVSKLPEYLNNWEAAKQSPAFEKVSELISIIATMGFIDGKYLSVTVKGINLFRLGTLRKHADVSDLLSAILSTLEFFISGGYEFFKTGNPRKFLFDGEDAKEFDYLYEMLLEATPHAKSLNLPIMRVEFKGEKILLDDVKYLEHLESAITLCKKCKKISKNTWQTSFFQTRLDRMIGWRADFNARRSNGKFRKAPLSMWIYGNSGVGKSSLSQLLIKSLLCYMGVPNDELDRIASINEQDKYDSTVTGGVHAYLTDDVMNTKADYLESAPTQKIVDHNNNAPLFANKAEIEGKGVTPHNPKITCYTSNCKIEQVAKQYSNCTESIRRRMIINLDVRIKPEFCLPGETRMDSNEVIRKFGTDPMPDIWEIIISECSSQSNTGMIELDSNFKPSLGEGYKFNIFETMEYCYMKADVHMKNQGVLQDIQSTLVEKMQLCQTCKRVGKMCKCAPITEVSRCEPQGILTSNPSDTSLDLQYSLNAFASPDDNETSIYPDYFRNQAEFEPAPSEWFIKPQTEVPIVREPDLDANIDIQVPRVSFWNLFNGMDSKAVYRTVNAPFRELVAWMEFMPTLMLDFGDILIARFFTHKKLRRFYWYLWSPVFADHIRNVILFSGIADIIISPIFYLLLPYRSFLCICAAFQVFLACTALVLIVKWYRDRMQILDQVGGVVQRTYGEIKRINWREVAKWASVAIVSYKVLKMILNAVKARNSLENLFQRQSALDPENVEEVQDRDAKVSDWAKPAWEELHVNHKARTTTVEQLKNKIRKNLYHVTFVAEDGSTNKCDGLVIEGNNMLLPLHVFGSKTKLKVLCRLKEGDGLNSVFKGHVALNMASVVKGLDLVLVSATFLNPHASLIDHFPEKITHTSGVGAFLYRDIDGTLRDDLVSYKTSMKHSGGTGYIYALPYKTFNGLCMGVLLGEYNVPCIAGVHLLGSPNTEIGIALNITQSMISDLNNGMKDKPVLNAMSNGDFPREMYGIEIVNQSSPIHPNSPLNYLPKYSKITALGNCPGRSSHTKSTVHKTIISDTVEEVCGVPCTWGAPKFNAKRQWQASMQYSANTSCGLDPELLEWAMNDYEEDLVKAFSNPKHVNWIKAEFKPLDDMEIMAGRDGARFLDAVPKNTSKGFPLSGPKEEWIVRLDPDSYEKFNCPVSIAPEVIEAAEGMCAKFRRGERAYTIFKACVKDEPTPLSKDKVRVFQASQWAFQLLVRKYFLPLARLMSLFPLQSECAVGINAHGPEWDEYAKFMKQHGDDRILAGDYSKFDLRMPAQMLMATYKVFCNVCEKCGTYSADDLLIMRGIATEISYSVVAYNGDLIIHNGSHPSGNNMTVYGNCVDNILNFRCGYAYNALKNGYTLKTLPKFKTVCALGTYGDDAKGSVKKGFDWFNHISFAKYMEENDIIFTMPDKESVPTKYMNDLESDFLKRKNVYNEETGLIHGALDEDSIFKSLHTVLKSTIGPKQHAAGNIETALREWFHHGRELFTLRHKQMIQIAERHQLQNLSKDVNEDVGVVMNSLYDDYDVRLAQFKRKHFES
jgi:hypothetical protein